MTNILTFNRKLAISYEKDYPTYGKSYTPLHYNNANWVRVGFTSGLAVPTEDYAYIYLLAYIAAIRTYKPELLLVFPKTHQMTSPTTKSATRWRRQFMQIESKQDLFMRWHEGCSVRYLYFSLPRRHRVVKAKNGKDGPGKNYSPSLVQPKFSWSVIFQPVAILVEGIHFPYEYSSLRCTGRNGPNYRCASVCN